MLCIAQISTDTVSDIYIMLQYIYIYIYIYVYNSEAVLLVDTTNAFSSLNRQVALQNVLHLCLSIAPVIVNTYRADAQLFVDGEVIATPEEVRLKVMPWQWLCTPLPLYISSSNWTS